MTPSVRRRAIRRVLHTSGVKQIDVQRYVSAENSAAASKANIQKMADTLDRAVKMVNTLKSLNDNERKDGVATLKDLYDNIDNVQQASIDLREAVINLEYSLRTAGSARDRLTKS